jgi:hypothetical protein
VLLGYRLKKHHSPQKTSEKKVPPKQENQRMRRVLFCQFFILADYQPFPNPLTILMIELIQHVKVYHQYD